MGYFRESVTKYMICLDLPLKVVFLFHLPARRKNIKVFFYVQCSHLRHRTHLKIVEFIAIECDHMFDSGKCINSPYLLTYLKIECG